MKKSLRDWATGYGWESLPNEMRSEMMEAHNEIERLRSALDKIQRGAGMTADNMREIAMNAL